MAVALLSAAAQASPQAMPHGSMAASHAASSASASASTSAARKAARKEESRPAVDINRASVSSLKSLPGIGDAEAHRIVAGRPYLSKAELVTKKVLPEGPYLAIRRHIIAKQNPSTVQAKQKA